MAYRAHKGGIGTQVNIARLKKVRALFLREKTLRAAGERLGLSPEWVRQLLIRGDKLGLFSYPPPRPRIPGPEEFRKACRAAGSKSAVALRFGLSVPMVRELGRRYGADWADIRAQAKERRKRYYLERLRRLAERLGHTPTTSEVIARGILKGIQQYCGPLRAARRAAGLADPPPMSEAAWRGMRRRDERRHRARYRRLAPLRRELAKGPVRRVVLSGRLNMRPSAIDYFLKILLAEGRAKRIMTPTGPKWVLRPSRSPRR